MDPVDSLTPAPTPRARDETQVTSPPIRAPETSDVERIKEIAVDAGMFEADEVAFFDDLLLGYLDGSSADHRWLVVDGPEGAAVAAAYWAPEPFADRVWNLYFLAVAPEGQGRGLGTSIVGHIERELRSLGDDVARVLIVETSSTDQYRRTRAFYRSLGYDEEARIRQFYGPGDDKVVFWKALAGPK